MAEWWVWFWQVLGEAGPIANGLQISTAAIGGFGFAYFFVRRRWIRHAETEIALLREDRDRREEAAKREANRADTLQRQLVRAEARLPEAALRAAEREWHQGNDKLAQGKLTDWLFQEGKPVARLLVHQAEWVAARAVGDIRSEVLSVAKGLAEAALVFDIDNKAARSLSTNIESLFTAEGFKPTAFPATLRWFRQRELDDRFDADEVATALAAQREARRLHSRGLYHLALPLVSRAVTIMRRLLGPAALQTMAARRDEVFVQIDRGDYEAALRNIDAVAAEESRIRPDHPDTLVSRYLQAQVLDRLGQTQDALPIIRQVVAAQEANPAIGPDHPDTIESRHLLAQVLSGLGRTHEALPIIRQVVAAREANAAMGAEHPDTLSSRYLLAEVLDRLGQTEDALPIIRQVIAAEEADPAMGADHPHTLASRYLLAHVLDRLGRTQEALAIIRQVVAALEANAAIGPDHPHTLVSRRLEAQLLDRLGQTQDALPIIRHVIAALEASPTIGPGHPHTLVSRRLEAEMLDRLGQTQDALPIIRQVAAALEANAAIGPDHPHTLLSRRLEAQVLDRLGQTHDALLIIRQVVAAQEAHPAIGPGHPDTLASRELLARMIDRADKAG